MATMMRWLATAWGANAALASFLAFACCVATSRSAEIFNKVDVRFTPAVGEGSGSTDVDSTPMTMATLEVDASFNKATWMRNADTALHVRAMHANQSYPMHSSTTSTH
jgi:hypothetical protein